MAKLLYIQSSPQKERSRSNQVAAAFLESYRQSHPDDTIETLNVFDANLPSFDGLTVQAKYTIMHGAEHTAEERRAWDAVETIIEKFKSADKYVFSLPMWNFGIYTFKVGDNGYEGLVKGKPVVMIYARGGAYLQAVEYDKQKPYMEQILGFMGFEDIRSIVVEPTLAGGEEQAQKAVEDSVKKAMEFAAQF
jgi:FMN-dependent NADH-azoreductase